MKANTKAEIVSFLENNRSKLLDFGVTRIGLFGSFVRNEQNEKSDIDLLVEFDPAKKSFDNFIGLSYFIEDELNRPTEIITPESLSPYIGPEILNEVEFYAF